LNKNAKDFWGLHSCIVQLLGQWETGCVETKVADGIQTYKVQTLFHTLIFKL
jgi:hypothetical protein